MEFDTSKLQPEQFPMDEAMYGSYLRNLKELRISDGKVRIENSAMIISDETGVDRILIGFLANGF